MIDRENTIDNLEQNIRWIEEIECHQFPGWGNVTMAMRDAVELLKEQEPVKPERRYVFEPDKRFDKYRCTACDDILLRYRQHYCGNCGRRLKWND